jgi:carboxypeptidase family protein
MRHWLLLAVLCGRGALAQSDSAELRLSVRDASGDGLPAAVELVNQATATRQAVQLPPDGHYSFRNLPFGFYRLSVSHPGFAVASSLIELRSAVPQSREVTLNVQPIQSTVDVTEENTLLDVNQTGNAHYIGAQQVKERPAGLAGRGVIDLVTMEPGWTLEANGVLHPRESEYDTQFVLNGFPVYDNRSPAFAPPVEADDVESMKVFTSGIPAEFGEKLGGVIEINTQRNTSPGFHGTAVAEGGSFSTASGYLSGQYVQGRTTVSLSGQGFLTDRYLDPPVTENYTNHASYNSFSAAVERDLTDFDRLRISLDRSQTRFEVPDDLLQEAAGQRQDRNSQDTEGRVSYQHVFSGSLVGDLRGMVRDVNAGLWSNPLSTPISAEQNRDYREGYLNGSLAGHHGRHEWKTGVEARYASVDEQFGYAIQAYSVLGEPVIDPGYPPQYSFRGHALDREEAVYAQDRIRLGNFTLSGGARVDRYSLLVNVAGVSPRAAAAWHSDRLGLVLHASYDRTFGTPPFENILVSGSPATAALTGGIYLPLNPSRGNYYEGGFTKALGKRVRLDASYFRRDIRNFEDDDLLLNTGVSFPIAYHSATVRGVEAKLEIPRWGKFSGYLSYANTIGIAQYPIAGGLFLDEGSAALLTSTDRFPISQDQRNTARGWVRYQIVPRVWTAWTASYNSGLPVEDADQLPDVAFLLAQYGPNVVAHVNMDRGRVTPSFSMDASVGVELWRHEKRSVTVQADVLNVTNRFNLINFAGLLSGTAIAPPRGAAIRLRTEF